MARLVVVSLALLATSAVARATPHDAAPATDARDHATTAFAAVLANGTLATGLASCAALPSLACGAYTDSGIPGATASLPLGGWSSLAINASGCAPDADPTPCWGAAGRVEGALTAHRIAQVHANFMPQFFPAPPHQPSGALKAWLETHMAWLRQQVAARTDAARGGSSAAGDDSDGNGDSLSSGDNGAARWDMVRGLLAQLDGLVAGYAAVAPSQGLPALDTLNMLLLSLDGDLTTLVRMMPQSGMEPTGSHRGAALEDWLQRRAQVRGDGSDRATPPPPPPSPPPPPPLLDGHCSAVVRVTPGNASLLFGHSTWDAYASMTRCFKQVTMPVPHRQPPQEHAAGVVPRGGLVPPASRNGTRSGPRGSPPARGSTAATASPLWRPVTVRFSSTPGFLSSVDDFYVVPTAGLAVTETTNHVFNTSLYADVRATGALLSWVRAMAATYTATSGAQWARTFAALNGGEYNCQWMVVDLNRFRPNAPLRPGTLMVLEQLPGYVEWHDETAVLAESGYWASYNVPAFSAVYDASGWPAAAKAWGHQYTHDGCSRARLFARDAPAADDEAAVRRLLRYNDPSDPLQEGSTAYGIMSRHDLQPANRSAAGGCDTKVSSYERVIADGGSVMAILGPTVGGDGDGGVRGDDARDGGSALPPFTWSKSAWAAQSHVGQPDTFELPWVEMRAQSVVIVPGCATGGESGAGCV